MDFNDFGHINDLTLTATQVSSILAWHKNHEHLEGFQNTLDDVINPIMETIIYMGYGIAMEEYLNPKGYAQIQQKGNIDKAVKDARDYLGDGARVITNKAGDKIILSADGTRRIRFDINRPYPHTSPHGHVEELVGGDWIGAGQLYPYDVPHY